MKRLSLIALMASLLATSTVPVAQAGDGLFGDLFDGFMFDSKEPKDLSVANSLALTLLLRMIPEGIAINALNNASEEAVKNSALALGIENAIPAVFGGLESTAEILIFLSNLVRNATSGTLTANPTYNHEWTSEPTNIKTSVTIDVPTPGATDGSTTKQTIPVTVPLNIPKSMATKTSTVYQGYSLSNTGNKYQDAHKALFKAATLLALSSPFAYNVYSNWQKAKTGKEREAYLKQTTAALTKMTALKKKQWIKLVLNSLLLFGSGYLLIGSTCNSTDDQTTNFDNVMDRFNNSLRGKKFTKASTKKVGIGNSLIAIVGALGLAAGIKLEWDRTSERSKLLDDNFRFTEEELKEIEAKADEDDDEDDKPSKPLKTSAPVLAPKKVAGK